MIVDHRVGNRSAASAYALVCFLQSYDVGIDFLQHTKHAFGIASAVGADRLADIIAGNGDGG